MHQQISKQTGTRVFFCDAHSPWQRGSNENMNGLLRDYFPTCIGDSDVVVGSAARSVSRGCRAG
jgi:IS30 family transposase